MADISRLNENCNRKMQLMYGIGLLMAIFSLIGPSIGFAQSNTPSVQIASTYPWRGDTVKVQHDGEARLSVGAGVVDSLYWDLKWKTPTVFVGSTGWHWVDLYKGGQVERDSVFVEILPPCVEIPLYVSPNSETGNGCLRMKFNCRVEQVELLVLNRWGTLMWDTKDPEACLDLKFKGQLVSEGTYHYMIKYWDSKWEMYDLLGQFTVMR